MSQPRPDEALAVVIGRAGSKGLPGKNALPVAGRPMVDHSIEAARAARTVGRIVVSTDGAAIASAARDAGVEVIDRPASLAGDTATVAAAVRHAVSAAAFDGAVVVVLYANVPVRPTGLIDEAVTRLIETGADSVQSYCDVGKHHPWWMVTLDDRHRVAPHVEHAVDRRQDLPPLFLPDGGVIAVRRTGLMSSSDDHPHAFLGADRRGVVTRPGAVVDVDTAADLALAEAALQDGSGRVKIAGREIGPGHPPYVIAELGVNHDGAVDTALAMTSAAADAGADAVKLQFFQANRLLGDAAALAGYQKRAGATDPRAMLDRLELDAEGTAAVIERARGCDLHAIVTVFSLESIAPVASLAWDAFKVASPDIINRPLIEALCTQGLPLLLSTGAATLDEVRDAVEWLGGHPHLLMQCVSAYPTPDDQAQLAGRAALAALDAAALGYSDHTTSVDTGALAVASGTCLLEKHLTLDPEAAGPDHAASLAPDAFAEYVRLAHRAHAMLGSREKRVLEIERNVRRISRQSVTAVGDLPTGHELRRDDLTVKRPGTGLPPARLDELVGRRLSRAVRASTPLSEEDLA